MQTYSFPGQTYITNPQTQHAMLTILAGGHIATSPSFHVSPYFSDCIMVLFTLTGRGRISFSEESIVVTPKSLLWHPCDNDCLIQKQTNDWDFYVFFLARPAKDLLPFPAFAPHHFFVQTKGNTMEEHIRLLAQNEPSLDLSYKLTDHKLLTNIFCDALLLLPDLSRTDTTPAPYLVQMKEMLDTNYIAPHSLAQFEELFDISRYRLCREFSKCYGESPIQYLNKLRIQKSMELLLHTDLNIRETGAAVGVENTNHFITLFRKYTGTTPLVYRRTTAKKNEDTTEGIPHQTITGKEK